MVDRLVGTEVNARRIAAVEAAFGKSGQPLAVPGRVLVGEGILIKICRKKPKQRQFFLFNDIFVYGTIIIKKHKYANQHIIPLEDMQIADISDDRGSQFAFLVKTRKKSFEVQANGEAEKREWMAHITRCINERTKSSGVKPAADLAAVWVPDVEAKTCMLCNKTQFNVLQRRHHCRACGKVVCSACSANRVIIKGMSESKPVRVCSHCFDRITSSGVNRESTISVPPEENDHSGDSESDSDDEGSSTIAQNTDESTFYPKSP